MLNGSDCHRVTEVAECRQQVILLCDLGASVVIEIQISNFKSDILLQLCPSFLDFSVAARTALMTTPRSLPFSSSCRPSMVVPPGLVT